MSGREVEKGAVTPPPGAVKIKILEESSMETKEKKKKGKAKWIVLAVVVVVIIAAIAGGGNDNTSQTPSSEDPVATSEQSASNQETSEEKKDADVPTEYKNALKKAQTYSKTMHMSKQGIYDQLVSEYGENFPPEAAQYAIDNLWKPTTRQTRLRRQRHTMKQ